MITIIHGPQASGKSFHKAAFARHYGCTHIVDDWQPREHEVPDDHRLCLTTADPNEIMEAIHMDRPRQLYHDSGVRVAIGVPEWGPNVTERLAR